MSRAVEKMDTPTLAKECALRWAFAGLACPECRAALYANQMLAPITLAYHRCPACRLNFVQRDQIPSLDKLADEMLDELARRTDLISWPRHEFRRLNEKLGALDPVPQPEVWRG